MLCCVLLGSIILSSQADTNVVDDSQKIKKITIRGLVKHAPRLVRSYLPVSEGDQFSKQAMQDIVRSLFVSDFFRDIKVYQNDGELIIQLVERPWISEILISGNKLIEKEQLTSILEDRNIIENRAFNNEKFTQIISEIENLYYLQGYYGVKIAVENKPLDNQRVSLKVDIFEGDITRIARINLIGNKAYQQKDLIRLFQVRTDSPDYLFDSKDSYVKASLEGDLQRLSNFYQNQGYARHRLLDRQVSLLPDKSAVFINIHMEEGEVYNFSDVNINGYEKVLSKKEVDKLLLIKKGETFSREKIIQTVDNVRKAIQNHGYAFAQVNPIVRIKDDTQEVFVTIQVNIGKRVYVRRIIFTGNNLTLDDVIRLEMRQYEQALYIPQKVDLSKRRLNRLGFFSSVDVNSIQVSDQQVDLLVKMNEQRTGSLNMRLGYSPQSGVIYQFSVAENNWLGRGYQTKIELDLQENSEGAVLSFTDRHFFEDEVSFSWDASYRRRDNKNISENSYVIDQMASNITVGVPVTEDIRFSYGLGFSQEDLECGSVFLTCQSFVQDHEKNLDVVSVSLSGRWDLRNRGFLPSEGSLHNYSYKMSLPDIGLSYYSATLQSQFYGALERSQRSTIRFRIVNDFIQGYNGDSVPFYKKLFVGGERTVRGYRFASLGPKYVQSVDGIEGYKGGNLRSIVNLDLYIAVDERDVFTNTDDNFRLNLFLDSGYAFNEVGDFSTDSFRSSIGIGWIYFSPIGVINIFYGLPINQINGDDIDQFGFALGTSL